ncbi:hypothetical protein BV22DRAFT_1135723 [Leucogyrophana mollusca]|uniref:Uncharacterized protein n=1 Tax=Leucogyrophana mollusca TaxID=85980 RepID=A0ACB8AVS9_9AGAM|nr:hypothetical protein BV22DRAFT_1135723 [Leucogyrophana mollusca]
MAGVSESLSLKRKPKGLMTGDTSSKRAKAKPPNKPPQEPVATVQTAIYSVEMFAPKSWLKSPH